MKQGALSVTMIPEKYDVALSYASEQREYVEQVFFFITSKGLTAYYDQAHASKMWGRDLAEYLEQVFLHRSKWCIMFISKEYAAKMWPKFERQTIIARQVESGEYVLPVRFDKTDIPGLNPNIVYQDASELTPKQLADLFERLFFERPRA
jgi:hypothetical protein